MVVFVYINVILDVVSGGPRWSDWSSRQMILLDVLIGAHALVENLALLSRDGRRFCAGRTSLIKIYNLDGPSSLPPSSPSSTDDELRATTSLGTTAALTTDLDGDQSSATVKAFSLDPDYTGGFIFSEAIFNNKTLASDFGITTTGLFGTWTLQSNGSDGTPPTTPSIFS
jgi:hypothetical protein